MPRQTINPRRGKGDAKSADLLRRAFPRRSANILPHARRGFVGAAACPARTNSIRRNRRSVCLPACRGSLYSEQPARRCLPACRGSLWTVQTVSPYRPSSVCPDGQPPSPRGRLFFRLAGTSPEKSRSNTHLSLTFPVGKVTIDSVWCTRGLYNSLCFIFIRHLPVGFIAPHGVSLC